MSLSTLLSGDLILADAGCSVLLVPLNLALDDQPLPDSGDEQGSSTGDHDGTKIPLFSVIAEVTLDTIVAKEEETAAACYAQAEDLDGL